MTNTPEQTLPLTPEQAREEAAEIESQAVSFGGEAGRSMNGIAATLRAYADLVEAVREMLPHYEGMETGDGEPCPQMARLRSLMEKK